MIKVRNSKQARKSMMKWIKESTQEAAEVANGLTVTAFVQILEHSAQQTGDFAGNWQYSINSVNYEFKELGLAEEEADWFIMGDTPAIIHAMQNNHGRDRGFKLGDTFHIANSAKGGIHGDAYAHKIESGAIKFRSGNMGMPVANAALYLGAFYGRPNLAQATLLRGKRL